MLDIGSLVVLQYGIELYYWYPALLNMHRLIWKRALFVSRDVTWFDYV